MSQITQTVQKLYRAGRMPSHTYLPALLVDGAVFPAAQFLISMAQKNLVNAVAYNQPGLMMRVYVCLGLIMLLVTVVNAAADYGMTRSVRIWTGHMRVQILNKLLSVPFSYLEQAHSGDLMSRADSDLDTAASLFSWAFLRLLLAVFYGIGSVVILLYLCWPLALVVSVLAAVQVLVMTRLSLKIKEHSAAIQEQTGFGNALFLDIVKALRLIRMFSAAHWLFGRYSEVNARVRRVSLRRNRRILTINALSDLFTAINLLTTVGMGLFLYFNGLTDLGSVMAFLVLQDGVSYMRFNLAEFFPSLQQAAACAERLFALLDTEEESKEEITESEAVEKNIKNPATGLSEGVVCEDLRFTYPNTATPVLEAFNVRFEAGKITLITGPSGCGKTTLLRLLAGLYRPEAGRIYFNGAGHNGTDCNTAPLSYTCVAYVPQAVHLFYDTVENNIRCGTSFPASPSVTEAAEAAAAHLFIMEKPDGYQTRVSERGANFSGGQKQRIAIARAAYRNAPVILWDEAESAVDTEHEKSLFAYLRQQAGEGKIIIVVSHRASVKALADTEVMLRLPSVPS